jgi:cell division protein FtsN
MSDHHDRGAYTPQSDAPLAFDARSSRRGGRQPMPMTLIISGVILIVLIAGMAAFFVHNAREGSTPATAGQSIDAIKSPPNVPDAKPATQNGVQIGYTEGQPLPPDTSATPGATAPAAGAAPTFTPPPEAPGARPAPGTAPPATTAKAPTIDAVLARAQPKTEDEVIAQAQAQRSAPATPKPAAPTQVAKVDAAPKAATLAKPTIKPTASAVSGPMVQIGAFSSEVLAEQSMNAIAAKIPGRTAGKTLKIEKAEVGGKTLNRALVGGFKSKADADSFCDALKAQGGACSVRE